MDEAQAIKSTAVETTLNFVKRGEKVVFYATDRKRSHMPLEEHRVGIADARPHLDDFGMEKSGFALLKHKTAVKNFWDPDEVKRVYYPEIQALLKKTIGAEKTICFGEIARSDDPATADGGKPSYSAHVDYGDFTTREFARNEMGEAEAEKWLERRYIFINLWRPITIVERTPLALCDRRTVKDDDLFGSEVRGGLNDPNRPPLYGFNLAYAPAQRWYYAPRMQPDEIWAFKIHDSDGSRIGGVPHSAFDDPTSPPNAKPRQSIEIRTISFMPE
jgi:hypothetical protein